jgi:inorganic pyrophosphatase
MKKTGTKKTNRENRANDKTTTYRAIVDTPKGSRNKYKIDEESGRFKLGSVLTAGMVFPYDFGYLSETRGEDGDALDVLILMDEPAFVGCQVEVQVIGAIEAEQTEGGQSMRNDRLIAVAIESHTFNEVSELSEVSQRLLAEIEHFFISYNQMKGKVFDPTGRADAARAEALIAEGVRNHKKTRTRKRKSA